MNFNKAVNVSTEATLVYLWIYPEFKKNCRSLLTEAADDKRKRHRDKKQRADAVEMKHKNSDCESIGLKIDIL